MLKSYFICAHYIINFTKVSHIYQSEGFVRVHLYNSSAELHKTNAEDFLAQYTAWLDSQSTPQL